MYQHEVQDGETLEIIAGRYTGDERMAYELACANPHMHVQQHVSLGAPIQFKPLRHGQMLILPNGWAQLAQGATRTGGNSSRSVDSRRPQNRALTGESSLPSPAFRWPPCIGSRSKVERQLRGFSRTNALARAWIRSNSSGASISPANS